ncbi:MAG TPA: multiheme c-type cytochrome [Thermoanaerobaculia bacterium]|jgi:hypothetical protein|nr:multiheme c-type cytochrome [Thermoanaerobaculia bacterium]
MNRRRHLAASLIGALGLALAAGGQPPAVAPPSPLEPPATAGLYVGAPSCASSNCHGSTRPRRVFDVLQNEHFTWYKADPHYKKAYPVLFNERSAAIARNLRLPAAPAESQICLGCHAFVVPKEKQANRLEIEDGISCEACHGPASGWIQSHTAEDWSHERSVAAGMTDLRNLAVRANLCLSCHLGSANQTVDHDLIAAGHPVLGFELDNYSEDMPAHWMPLRDKQRKEGMRDTHGIRAWAVGQAANFRAGLDQLARHARSPHWPEFSEMRCESCHHTLAEQRWKTSRYSDRPGLPRWSPARWAVLRHLVAAVAPDARASLDADVASLAQQVARLGTPRDEVAETAERISGALAGIIPRLDEAAWDDSQVQRLLLAISGDDELAADRATAMQGFLAANSLVAQLQARNPRRVRAGLAGTLDNLQKEFDNEYAWNPGRFTSQLAQLRRQVEGLP